MKQSQQKLQTGFTLIELMLALVLGLILMGGVMQIFQSSQQSYLMQENMSRMQENGRFAMDFISRSIRNSDYWGCPKRSTDIKSILNASNVFGNFPNADIKGITGINNDTDNTNEIRNHTDTITLTGVEPSESFVVQQPTNKIQNIQVNDSSDFKNGDVVVLSDCSKGNLFQITNNPSSENNYVGHTKIAADGKSSARSPGNSTGNFRKLFPKNSQLYKAKYVTYSIGESNNQPTFFRTVNGVKQALVEGIEDMQILYGADINNDFTADYYTTANTIGLDMSKVVSIRVNLLVVSLNDNLAAGYFPYTYNGKEYTPKDRKIRRVFSSTIAIRNRLR